ncbi:hypothetical protein ACFLRX_05060, partial [Acidobacteriota bacterium]
MRLPLQGIPLYIASAILITIIATGAYFLTKKSGASGQSVEIEPISVLLADFENNTGEPIFDGALEQAFGISLEGASYISMYDRLDAKELVIQLYPGATDSLNMERAQLLCGRE